MRRLSLRLLDAIVLLWLVVTLTFVLLHGAPGDPASLLVAPSATAAEIAQTRARLGLDAPLPVQYARWIGTVLQGELGVSVATSQSVRTMLDEAIPVSVGLGAVSLCLSLLVGGALGAWQALRASRSRDLLLTLVNTAAVATPSFWLALSLVVVSTSGAALLGLPTWLRLPAFGMSTPAGAPAGWAGFTDLARHAVLPVLVLTIPGAAGVARFARQAIGEARRAPHVAAATARGLPRGRIELRYILRLALPPLVVLVGLMLPGIIAGSVFVEQVFAWPGMGRLLLTAIAGRDYPVVLAVTLFYGAAVILCNLAADLLTIWLDPVQRQRHAAAGIP